MSASSSNAEELIRISKMGLSPFRPDLAEKAVPCTCGRMIRDDVGDVEFRRTCLHEPHVSFMSCCLVDGKGHITKRCYPCQKDVDFLQSTSSQFQCVYYEQWVSGWAEMWKCSKCNYCMAIDDMPSNMMRNVLLVKMRQAHGLVCDLLATGRSDV
jgi:hypothetical protein